jgi:hypothetical protein
LCRFYVPPGQMAIVTSKVGKEPAPGTILVGPGEKGIRHDVLAEGRHFLDPFCYEIKIVPAIEIPLGKVGVVTSKVGRELPPGEIIAAERDGKGVWRNVLGPGTYRLNPEGYEVTQLDAINIPIGYVGIVTSQTGKPVKPGEFAGPGQQGVMKDVLQPGLYYVNPRAYQVDVLEIGMNQVSIIGRSGSVVLTKSQISSASSALDSLQQNTIQAQQEKRNEYLNKNARQLVGHLLLEELAALAVDEVARLVGGAFEARDREDLRQQDLVDHGGQVAVDHVDARDVLRQELELDGHVEQDLEAVARGELDEAVDAEGNRLLRDGRHLLAERVCLLGLQLLRLIRQAGCTGRPAISRLRTHFFIGQVFRPSRV